jgi:radical SAM protein
MGAKSGDSMNVDFDISPFVVIWENTRACDLSCIHCRAAAQPLRNRFELTTEEGFQLIDQIAELKPKVFVLTGGDPLKRDDTYALIQYARMKGLEPSLTPSATPLLTEEAVTKMKAHGLGRMAVSLDASNAAEHDAFRRVEGSFDLTLRAIRQAAREKIPVQVNTTVTRRTVADLPNMVTMLEDLGITMWSVFFAVPTGRAKESDLITAREVEELFGFLFETSKRVSFSIRTTEAMHYRRYVLQHGGAMPLGVHPNPDALDSNGAPRAPRGVNEAKGFVFISHIGDVYPSGFLPMKAGNVRLQSLGDIYRTSKLFVALRDPNNLRGKCGRCEYRDLCGGSRARAWAMTGDVFASDPLCAYQPS